MNRNWKTSILFEISFAPLYQFEEFKRITGTLVSFYPWNIAGKFSKGNRVGSTIYFFYND
jgi:hypothetical protein